MKNLHYLNEYRILLHGMETAGDEHNGAFELKIKGERYRVVASNGQGWEHVSISSKHKVPSWKTMCIVKDLFFEEEEAVIQFHPRKSEYVNNHPNCLHLWKPTNEKLPIPPSWLVGIS